MITPAFDNSRLQFSWSKTYDAPMFPPLKAYKRVVQQLEEQITILKQNYSEKIKLIEQEKWKNPDQNFGIDSSIYVCVVDKTLYEKLRTSESLGLLAEQLGTPPLE